jgi:DNA repair protein RecN (Recombination protein N)
MLVSANPGEAPKPVSKVASGGELARISLALSLVTATDRHATMVFDEVDAGVGGEAARAVGKALADLSASTQVMLVTHLPQVAAFADRHYKVTKTTAPGHTEARVEHIEGEARVEELSRMLSGLPDSERAKHHARELLELAGA